MNWIKSNTLCSNTYMHTHTYTRIHKHTHIHEYTHTYLHTYTSLHTHTSTDTHIYTNIHTYTYLFLKICGNALKDGVLSYCNREGGEGHRGQSGRREKWKNGGREGGGGGEEWRLRVDSDVSHWMWCGCIKKEKWKNVRWEKKHFF